jgi:hypothetical protein
LQKQRTSRLEKLDTEAKQLLPKDKEAESKRLMEIEAACTAKESELQGLRLRLAKIDELREGAERLFKAWQREADELKRRFNQAGLADQEWLIFRPQSDDRRSQVIASAKERTEGEIKRLLEDTSRDDPNKPETWSLNHLRAQKKSLADELGVEKERSRKHADLQRQITALKAEIAAADAEIVDAKGADERRRKLLGATAQRTLAAQRLSSRPMSPARATRYPCSGSSPESSLRPRLARAKLVRPRDRLPVGEFADEQVGQHNMHWRRQRRTAGLHRPCRRRLCWPTGSSEGSSRRAIVVVEPLENRPGDDPPEPLLSAELRQAAAP